MRTIRLYCPALTPSNTPVLGAAEQHRLKNVLRVKPGTPIELFNGQGLMLKVAVKQTQNIADENNKPQETVHKKKNYSHQSNAGIALEVMDGPAYAPPPTLSVHYGLALTKGERFEWALEKLTELGVRQITPVICAHNEVRLNEARLEKKLQQWRNTLIAATEQCGLNWLPQLNEPTDISQWVSTVKSQTSRQWILTPHGTHNALPTPQNLSTQPTPTSLAIVSGPEGGLSTAELQAALTQGFEPIQLGPRVLRAETAPICGLTLAHYLWGDTLGNDTLGT